MASVWVNKMASVRATVLLLVLAVAARRVCCGEAEGHSVIYKRNFTMPGASPPEPEAYLCTAMTLNASQEEWVVRFDPLASANRAHHMLLYGCSDVPQKTGYWDCGHHGVCQNGRIMYAWAKNAPSTSLPPGVGFRIGGDSTIKYLTLQIHYAVALPDVEDHSGLSMDLTTQQQQYKAGILLLVDGQARIPANTEKYHADVSCRTKSANVPVDINVFGARVHTHKLGVVVSGYKYDLETMQYEQIAKGNPQWPQAFYPRDSVLTIKPTDVVTARCTYNSTGRNRFTFIGSTAKDEMCNLYLMYYTDRTRGVEAAVCGGNNYPEVVDHLPEGNDVALPSNPLLEEKAKGDNTNKNIEVTYKPPPVTEPQPEAIKVEKKAHHYEKVPPQDEKYKLHPKLVAANKATQEQVQAATSPQQGAGDEGGSRTNKMINSAEYQVVSGWASQLPDLGQVVAVAIDNANDVVIFHRGGRVWDGSTFTLENRLANTSESGVIATPTLLHLSRETGALLHQWGEGFFYLPHGLTIDDHDNMWLTDVGMHQVFKFPPQFGDGKPLMTLGTKFEPGSDSTHFCKPTSVAVLKTGEFFVADGYCNARVIKYSKEGKVITQFGKMAEGSFLSSLAGSAPPPGTFNVPHSLALAEDKGEVCVADRENGRVQCYDISDAPRHTRVFRNDFWGSRIFAVAYSPVNGGRIYCVNGPQMFGGHEIQVYELEFASGQVLATFSPNNQGLTYAHDVAVTTDGAEFYAAEIGPNKIWKFISDSLLKARPSPAPQLQEAALHVNQILHGVGSGISKLVGGQGAPLGTGQWSTAGVSTVVLGLLAVPIVVLTSVTLIVRANRRGKIHLRSSRNGSAAATNGTTNWRSDSNSLHQLGSSLLNKHRGFRQLATEDVDEPSSGESDVEEFSQIATKA